MAMAGTTSHFASASEGEFKSLSSIRLPKTRGHVSLKGQYHARGVFKCDENFFQGGRIYFTLGVEDYSYTLTELLLTPNVLRKNKESNAPLRTLASQSEMLSSASVVWGVQKNKEIASEVLSFVPNKKESEVKKLQFVFSPDKKLVVISMDFGAYNLQFLRH